MMSEAARTGARTAQPLTSAFGSFYNHFESKEAVVEAVLAEAVAAQGAAVECVTRDLDDPAEVAEDAAEVARRPMPKVPEPRT